MHYVLADVHNDNKKFSKMLKLIQFSEQDHLYILGDLFDRASYNPEPLELDRIKYLMAHAMTSEPQKLQADDYYLQGGFAEKDYLEHGIEGYISICGHSNKYHHIWKNQKGNVYLCDCGCGYSDGRLGCLCLETGEEFYIES